LAKIISTNVSVQFLRRLGNRRVGLARGARVHRSARVRVESGLDGRELAVSEWIDSSGSDPMTQKNRTPRRSSVIVADIGRGTGQVAAHPHDSGSQANETVDGLDATTESLRHATEDMPATGTGPSDIEKTPVFDRAGEAPRIWAGSRL
jgi:hypothetical protein